MCTSRSSADIPPEENWCFTRMNVSKFSIVWTITDFSMTMTRPGESLKSSPFWAVDNDKLQMALVLYPNGETETNKKYVSVYLQLEYSDLPVVTVKFELTILNARGRKKYARKVTRIYEFPKRNSWGFCRYIMRDTLLDRARGLLVSDQLTLHCDVNVVTGSTTTSRPLDRVAKCLVPQCRLVDDFSRMFEERKFCDVVLKAPSGIEFPAHKCVLAARSAVFEAMFSHEMEESSQNRVVITDVPHEVLRGMLRFMYIGNVPEPSSLTGELLMAADKYGLDRLKALCEDHLSQNALSMLSATALFILASFTNAYQLRARVLDFIARHSTDFVKHPLWEDLLVTHPDLAAEISKVLAAESTRLGTKPSKPSSLIRFLKK